MIFNPGVSGNADGTEWIEINAYGDQGVQTRAGGGATDLATVSFPVKETPQIVLILFEDILYEEVATNASLAIGNPSFFGGSNWDLIVNARSSGISNVSSASESNGMMTMTIGRDPHAIGNRIWVLPIYDVPEVQ